MNSPFGPMFSMMPAHGEPSPMMERRDTVVPARVQIAMQFLQSLNEKTRLIVVNNAAGVTSTEKPAPLITEELSAQVTACDVVTKYLMGQLKPDPWEEIELKKRGNEVVELEKKIVHASLAQCPSCTGPAGPTGKAISGMPCPMCKGERLVAIVPKSAMQ